jgi:hypothetical protein
VNQGSWYQFVPSSPVQRNGTRKKGLFPMAVRSGRIERRIRLAVPIQISSTLEPSATERTTTENVCSVGARVLSQKNRKLNESLVVATAAGDLKAPARVVYCERLPDGRYGIGLEFQGMTFHWTGTPSGVKIS